MPAAILDKKQLVKLATLSLHLNASQPMRILLFFVSRMNHIHIHTVAILAAEIT